MKFYFWGAMEEEEASERKGRAGGRSAGGEGGGLDTASALAGQLERRMETEKKDIKNE